MEIKLGVSSVVPRGWKVQWFPEDSFEGANQWFPEGGRFSGSGRIHLREQIRQK